MILRALYLRTNKKICLDMHLKDEKHCSVREVPSWVLNGLQLLVEERSLIMKKVEILK